jgi:hypothetical protein
VKNRQTTIGYALTGALLISGFLLSLVLEGDHRDAFFREGGVIESASVFGYFLCAALMVLKGKINYLKRYHYFFVMIILFMLRELDFDKQFTTISILKKGFYVSDRVPLAEKIVGAMFITILLYVSVSILSRHSKGFFVGLRKRSPISLDALLAIALLVISKSLDGLTRRLGKLGIEVSQRIIMHAEACEEILELGIPVAILLTLIAHLKDIDVKSGEWTFVPHHSPK